MSPSVEPFNEAKYKALMDGLECKEIYKSKLERTLRIDAEFYSKFFIDISEKLSSHNHEPLTDCVNVSDGNHMGISDHFCEEGIPYYRGQDAGSFFIESSKPICIDEDVFHLPVMRRSHLKQGDVLLSIVGTIGALSLVYDNKKATCSCKLAILRPKKGKSSELLATFLRSKYGQSQITRFTRGAIQKGLILEDMDQLIVPTFGDSFVNAIEKIIRDSYQLQETALAAYGKAEEILQSKLLVDISSAKPISQKSVLDSLGKFGRLDAEYYQEKYHLYETAILSATQEFTYVKDAFSPVKEKCSRNLNSYNYVEIGNIDVKTGKASFNTVCTEDLPDNAKIMTKCGDVLVSTVRPNRGAVAILEEDGLLVSGAFTVLREKGNYPKEILQVLLRTSIYKDWLLRFNVGTSYPVIKDEDVLNMPIPVFDEGICQETVKKIADAALFRCQSKQLLEDAKCAVEIAIEQGENVAIEWLKEKRGEC